MSDLVELGPAQTIQQMADRHRTRVAANSAEGQPLIDLDVPFMDDGADW